LANVSTKEEWYELIGIDPRDETALDDLTSYMAAQKEMTAVIKDNTKYIIVVYEMIVELYRYRNIAYKIFEETIKPELEALAAKSDNLLGAPSAWLRKILNQRIVPYLPELSSGADLRIDVKNAEKHLSTDPIALGTISS